MPDLELRGPGVWPAGMVHRLTLPQGAVIDFGRRESAERFRAHHGGTVVTVWAATGIPVVLGSAEAGVAAAG